MPMHIWHIPFPSIPSAAVRALVYPWSVYEVFYMFRKNVLILPACLHPLLILFLSALLPLPKTSLRTDDTACPLPVTGVLQAAHRKDLPLGILILLPVEYPVLDYLIS